jgi:hypothetical protein
VTRDGTDAMNDPQPVLPSPAPAAAAGATSVLAVVSLVTGILTWLSSPLLLLGIPTPVCTVAAIVCGHLARAEIRRNPSLQGDGMAIAGLVLGWASVLAAVLAIVAVLLLFGGIAAFIAWAGMQGS